MLFEQERDRFLPTGQDRQFLVNIISNEKDWILPKVGARDPMTTIQEPRKVAINL